MNKEELASASFETLMAELKKTLDMLEIGELPLESSMSAYEYGVSLVRCAEEKLAKMEGRMEEIMTDNTVKPLDEGAFMSEQHEA